MRRLACATCAAAALAVTSFAAETANADVVDTSAGVKAMAGGSLWTTPSDRPGNDQYEGIGFAGNGGGFSYGGGLYFEARFIKVLSLELDLLYDKSTLMRNIDHTHNGLLFKLQEKLVLTNLRIPVLVKANLPTPFGRLFVLLGPEFVRTSSVDTSVEVKESPVTVDPATEAALDNSLTARKGNYTMITGGMGLTIDLVKLEIPLELRASKNLGQESAYDDRVDWGSSSYDVDAQTSWDFRVSAGLGYRF